MKIDVLPDRVVGTMNVKFARPSVADLVFQVFDRSVHPELTTCYTRQFFVRDDYFAEVRICEAGHLVSLRNIAGTVTEIAGSSDQLLPKARRSFCQRLHGSRHRSVTFASGIKYDAGFQIEHLASDVFLNFHQELLIDAERVEVAHAFPAGTRFSPPPLSLIRVDAQSDSLLVHAYHTFPESCAVVKSQSLFEL